MSYMPAHYFTLPYGPWDLARRVLDPRGPNQPGEYPNTRWHSRDPSRLISTRGLGGIPTSKSALFHAVGCRPHAETTCSCGLLSLEANHAGEPTEMSKRERTATSHNQVVWRRDRDQMCFHIAQPNQPGEYSNTPILDGTPETRVGSNTRGLGPESGPIPVV
jgi:hypothetical protein